MFLTTFPTFKLTVETCFYAGCVPVIYIYMDGIRIRNYIYSSSERGLEYDIAGSSYVTIISKISFAMLFFNYFFED